MDTMNTDFFQTMVDIYHNGGKIYRYEQHVGGIDNKFTYSIIDWITNTEENPYPAETKENWIFNHLKVLYRKWERKEIDGRLSYRRLSQFAAQLIDLLESKQKEQSTVDAVEPVPEAISELQATVEETVEEHKTDALVVEAEPQTIDEAKDTANAQTQEQPAIQEKTEQAKMHVLGVVPNNTSNNKQSFPKKHKK